MAVDWCRGWRHRPQLAAGPGARCWLGLRQGSQDGVEYTLIIATVALVMLLGMTAFSSLIEVWFSALIRLIVGR